MKSRKSILASTLCLLMIVFAVLGLTACSTEPDDSCVHEWSDWAEVQSATCAVPGSKARICSLCGKTETETIPTLEHDWADATCTAPKTCQTCSATEGEPLPHTFDQEVAEEKYLKTPATETSAAVYYKSCVCGEKGTETFTSGDPLDPDAHTHTFDQEVATEQYLKSEATCTSAAVYYKSCTCGAKGTETFTSGKPLPHSYGQDGVCANCGAQQAVDENNYFYLNFLHSYKGINGFAVELKDLSFVLKKAESSAEGGWKLLGTIRQVDVAKLVLYVEDGKLFGAANGSLIIFNGPVSNEDAICSMKAVIQDGYVYLSVGYGKDSADEYTVEMKYSLDQVLGAMGMSSPSSVLDVLSSFAEILIPVADILMTAQAEDTDAIMGNLMNIFFTREEQSDGSYRFRLDYDKLHALNENLATLPIADVIDLYFGEGTFDAWVDNILALLNLTIPQILEHLEQSGVDVDALIDDIDALLRDAMGAPADFTIRDFLYAKEMANVTVGTLLAQAMDIEDVAQFINGIAAALHEATLYSMLVPDMNGLPEMVDSVITMLESSIAFSFATDESGALTAFHVGVTELKNETEDRSFALSFDLAVTMNGRIDVTWSDIMDVIDGKFVPPAEGMLDDSGSSHTEMIQGTMDYQGILYSYTGVALVFERTNFDALLGFQIEKDCRDWLSYHVMYAHESCEYRLLTLFADETSREPAYILAINMATGEIVQLAQTENAILVTYEGGSTKTVSAESAQSPEALFREIFGEPAFRFDGETRGYTYYYNKTTDSYANSSRHDMNVTFELLGETCKDGVLVRRTCKNCNYSSEYTDYGCTPEHFELDLSEYGGCAGIITGERCERCGKVQWINEMHTSCPTEDSAVSSEIKDENGVVHTVTTAICPVCGLKYVTDNWIEQTSPCVSIYYTATRLYSGENMIVEYIERFSEDRHEYEYTYELLGKTCDDGVNVTRFCSKCGENRTYTSHGHETERKEINLSEYGLCGGFVRIDRCRFCQEVLRSELNDYECDWRRTGDNDDGYVVYTCERCGTEEWVRTDRAESGNCLVTETRTVIFRKDAQEIYRYTNTYSYDQHRWEYDFNRFGETCEDGYEIIITCSVCGYQEPPQKFDDHQTFPMFVLNSDALGCCPDHYIEVWACPCGQRHEERFKPGNMTEESGRYVCETCGLVVEERRTSEKADGCSVVNTYSFIVSVSGTELYRFESASVSVAHNYALSGTVGPDGSLLVTVTCSDCGISKQMSVYAAELQSNGSGEYYFDFVFTPDITSSFTIESLSQLDTIVTLYQMSDDGLMDIQEDDDGGYKRNFCLTATLEAGKTYVYRIRYYSSSRSGTICFTFSAGIPSEDTCAHSTTHDIEFSPASEGNTTVYMLTVCDTCGAILCAQTSERSDDTIVIDLAEYGACFGSIVYNGALERSSFCTDAVEPIEETVTDEDGNEWQQVTWVCPKCGMCVVDRYRTVTDPDTGAVIAACIETITIGDTVITIGIALDQSTSEPIEFFIMVGDTTLVHVTSSEEVQNGNEDTLA